MEIVNRFGHPFEDMKDIEIRILDSIPTGITAFSEETDIYFIAKSLDDRLKNAQYSCARVAEENCAWKQAVIVNSDGEKYVVTAKHSIDFEKAEKGIAVWDSQLKQTKAKLVGMDHYRDFAVFAYEGSVPGAGIAEKFQEGELMLSMSYTHYFSDEWTKHQVPLVSIGIAAPLSENIVLYSGLVSNDSSGCGLFSLDGRVVGVCSRRNDNIRHKRLTEFASLIR